MKRRLLICVIIILIIFLTVILSGCKNNENELLKEKLDSEIFYIENELTKIANSLNNIDYANYKIVSKQKENASNKSTESEKNEKDLKESGDSNEQKKQANKDEQNGSSDVNAESSSESEEGTQKTFSMSPNDILNRSDEIDWKNLQNEIERIYTALTVIAVDLNEIGISENEINIFIGEIDKLTISIKNEQKEETLTNIINVYKYLPEFVKKYNESSAKYNLLTLKYNLLICYNDVSLNKWDNYENQIDNIKLICSNIENKSEEFDGKELNLKKVKVIIEEMKNCGNIKNQDVFFIKYKNLLQEINIL